MSKLEEALLDIAVAVGTAGIKGRSHRYLNAAHLPIILSETKICKIALERMTSKSDKLKTGDRLRGTLFPLWLRRAGQ